MDQERIELLETFDFRKVGATMPRERYQRGHVFYSGKRAKKVYGSYYFYVVGPDGKERRKHKTVKLGLKSQMSKWEAHKKLEQIIEAATGGNHPAKPDPELTFGWFWRNRYLPMKSKWSTSTLSVVTFVMEKHVLPYFEHTKLQDIDKFHIQKHLNELAKKYSESVVDKAYTYIRAVLNEAVEQEFLDRNPAKRVEMPKTKKPCKRNLTPNEIKLLWDNLEFKDRLILRCFGVTGARPGEVFALRWRDIQPGAIIIDESVSRNKLGEPKTETSCGKLVIPQELELMLVMWRSSCRRTAPDDFVFESRYHGRPRDWRSYMRRHLKPIALRLGIHGLTYQSLRRTFATQSQHEGSVKDVQTQMRHAHASTTLNIYTQEIPASVRAMVEAVDKKLFGHTDVGKVTKKNLDSN